jgi:hypothetical protein
VKVYDEASRCADHQTADDLYRLSLSEIFLLCLCSISMSNIKGAM